MAEYDIAICGAGPVGQTLALLLLKRGVAATRLLLIDAKTSAQAAADARNIALSFGSSQILQAAGAWPVQATAIHQIHISRRGHFGRTLIDRAAYKVPALGYLAPYAEILKPLSAELTNYLPELTFLRPAKVTGITQTEQHAVIELDDKRSITAAIVVQAEGGLFADQVAQIQHKDYHQTALVTTVKTSAPVAACAYERFTDQGPLALLPQADGYALVWCSRPETAAALMQLDDGAFLSALQTTFGERLGRFISSTARHSYALGLNAQTSAPAGRCISIGNAAQTLHPVAGQGLNLGLRDAFELARKLSLATTPVMLQDFYRARLTDRTTTIQLTSQMAQLFANSGRAQQSILSAGLGWFDVCLPVQTWLAKQMMYGQR